MSTGQWRKSLGYDVYVDEDGIINSVHFPSIIHKDGSKQWCINGHRMQESFYDWAEKVGIDLDNVSDEDAIQISLTYGDLSPIKNTLIIMFSEELIGVQPMTGPTGKIFSLPRKK